MPEFNVNAIIIAVVLTFLAISIAFTELSYLTVGENELQFKPCRSLKRSWNKDGSCGSCLDWHHSTSNEDNERCIPDDTVIVLMTQRNAFVPNGMPVLLKCQFDTDVLCSWKRRDDYVQPGENYQFNGSDVRTKDCDILLTEVKDTDTGDWECSSRAHHDSTAIFGTELYLSNEEVITVEHNATVYVPFGATVVLKCYFEEKVNCTWERNDEHINIADRYSFVSANNSGLRTRDCTIKIKPMDTLDVTRWECKSLATSFLNATLSTTVQLNLLHSPKIIEGPRGLHFASIGEKISLRCHFDMPVNCKWSRNGQNIGDTHGYQYKTKGKNSKDCSIKIESIRKEDIGQWRCDCEDCTNTQNDATSWIIKKQNIKVKGTRNESVPEGQAVTLICDDPTNNGNCKWTKLGVDVYEEDHYDHPATNCTLRIKNFRKKDEGKWECIPTMDLKKVKPTNSINLSTIRALGPFANGNIEFGQRVILRCWFQQDVTCSWTLGTTPINPVEGYEYIGTSIQTKDCSISIPKFDQEHVGQYVCNNRENHSMVGANMQLNGITSTQSQPKIYLANSKSNGENIVCVLENAMSDTDLHWELDGKKEPEVNRKVTLNLEIGLYDIKITLNFTKEKISNSTFLTCVTKQGQSSDQIRVIELQRFMTEQPEECSPNLIEKDCTSPSLIAYAIIISLLLLGVIIYNVCQIIKKRCTREDNGRSEMELNEGDQDDANRQLNPNPTDR